MHSISLNAEVVGHIGSLPITNTVLAMWLTMLVLLGVGIGVRRALTNNYQGFFGGVALLFEQLLTTLEDILGWQSIKVLFPLLATFFVTILTANWLGLLPGFGSIFTTGHEPAPILRGATTDLHLTLALAIISVVVIQLWGLKKLGVSYLKKYINVAAKPIWMLPINIFVGLLEIISELAKVLSFSLRLFGNIFAGEVLLSVMFGLIPLLVPGVFYGLELFVGFIQALVFVMLTSVFLKIAGEAHEADH